MAADIEHVVVLMLENRSFDCMLGLLYPSDGSFEGLTGQEFNNYAGRPVPVWKSATIDQAVATIPDPDPGELFADINAQLFAGPRTDEPPPMSGFVDNYMAQPQADKPRDPRAVLHYFTPDQVPVISTLAKNFGVCDQWHASAPCQTWPNRFFAHTGTARGHINNDTFLGPFTAESVFHRLGDAGHSWRVYFHDMPQSILCWDVWPSAPLHYRLFGQFLADAHAGALPSYSFIEPRYFTDPVVQTIPNDEHPPHDVLFGEALIAAVYNAVRSSPCWKKTLLVILYDEHGGCFDHVPPPGAVPPDACDQDGFAFDRYGVRVPAVVVSPFVPAGSIIRAAPAGLPHRGPPYPFDHTSVLATLRKLFGLGAPFSARDAAAPDLLSCLSLSIPANDGPASLVAKPPQASTSDVVARAAARPNGMQANLERLSATLVRPAEGTAPVVTPSVASTPQNVAMAHTVARARVNAFLRV